MFDTTDATGAFIDDGNDVVQGRVDDGVLDDPRSFSTSKLLWDKCGVCARLN